MFLELSKMEDIFLKRNLVCERNDSKPLNIRIDCTTFEHKYPVIPRSKAFRLAEKYIVYSPNISSS